MGVYAEDATLVVKPGYLSSGIARTETYVGAI